MRNRAYVIASFAALTLFTRGARADWPDLHVSLPYSQSVYDGGPGLRLGRAPLVLHAGVASEFGYDSNILYDYRPVEGAVMRIRAHLDLVTLTPQPGDGEVVTAPPRMLLRSSTQLEYREYFAAQNGIVASNNINLFSDNAFTLHPQGRFSLTLTDWLARTSDPVNVENTRNLIRDVNRFGLLAAWRPGGGSLQIGLGDYVHVNYMGENASYAFASFYGDEAQAFARWSILPQTHLMAVVRGGYFGYPGNPSQSSAPLRALVGASTLLTGWLGLAASVGYGNSFNQKGPSYNNFLGSAEVDVHLPYAGLIAARYEREFYPSVFANFYRDDMVALSFKQPLVKHLTAGLRGAVYLRPFEGLIDPKLINAVSYSSNVHTGPIYEARAELNVQPAKWLSCGASYGLQLDSTDFVFNYANYSVPDRYTKHTVMGRIDVAY
jgi:hypothetical protein